MTDTQALILLPHNNRGNPQVVVNMRGEQVGPIRFYTHSVVDGEQVPDYTYVMSEKEHQQMLAQGRHVEKHYFHGESFGED